MSVAHGSVEGGTFRFTAGHFEWLARFSESLGLQWHEITAAGASYAIEHWAAAGFWKELIAGLRAIKASRLADLPLGFWTWHGTLEAEHAAHTDAELREAFAKPAFAPERFIAAGEAMLDAVAGFWDGLDATAGAA